MFKIGTLISLVTGIRIGELYAMHWRDVSLVDKTILLKRFKELQITFLYIGFIETFHVDNISHLIAAEVLFAQCLQNRHFKNSAL